MKRCLILFFLLVTVCQASRATDVFINAGDLQVHCTVSGKGDALILLHGGFLDLHMWDKQESFFNQYYKVVRIDMPGHGATVGIDTLLEIKDVIRIVMDSLHIEKACVAGLSLGSVCATDFVLGYPERVSRLILVSPGITGWSKVIKMDTASQRITSTFTAARETGDSLQIAAVFTATWCDGPYRKPAEVSPTVRNYIYRTAIQNAKRENEWPVFNKHYAATRLKEIKCPLLIIDGDKDVLIVLQNAEYFHRQLPSTRMVTFPGVAHMVSMEKPDEFNKVVYDWIKGRGTTRPVSH